MLPDWLTAETDYTPPRGSSAFAIRTIRTIGRAMAQIKLQKGHEKGRALPPLFKLLLTIAAILLVSASQSRLVVMAYAAGILLYLATWPARDIWHIFRAALVAALFTLVLLTPAVILRPALLGSELFLAAKVFLTVTTISIMNHTTQWNHITTALRRLHVPGLAIFLLDITLKYIVLLGELVVALLTALELRSVGRSRSRYRSIGGVLGVTFLRGVEANREMVEAMRCRGFTDDYDTIAPAKTPARKSHEGQDYESH